MVSNANLERVLDYAGAVWVAACAGCAIALAAPELDVALVIPFSLCAGGAAGWLTYRALRQIDSKPHILPEFALVPIGRADPAAGGTSDAEPLPDDVMATPEAELLLLSAQMAIGPTADECNDELLLSDKLADVQPNSRVVQLFQSGVVPTAGELKLRIDKHLSDARNAVAPHQQPDDSQALYDALADLRRSLG